jgi:hypothetical protein
MSTEASTRALPRSIELRTSPIVFCRVAIWSFLALVITTTNADADLWGHLRFGLDVLASKSLHTSDPYSFTADRPWINHEWLSELLMGIAYQSLGSLGLGLLKLAAIGVVAATLLSAATEERARPLARDLFVAVAIFVSYSRTQVMRPQLFSVVLCCVVLYLLRQADRGRTKMLWLIPICFAAWANVHGGWIVGIALLGVWIIGEWWRQPRVGRGAMLGAVGLLSIAATLITPYGVGLWQFVAETVRPARPDITDWKPLLQLPPAILAIEAILPALAIAAVWHTRAHARPLVRDVAVLAVLTIATFRVGRVDAFLQVSIALLLARPIVTLFNSIDVSLRPSLRRESAIVGVLAICLAAYVAIASLRNVRVVRVQGQWIPDRTAALLLREARPGAKVLTWFDWGEYAIWQLSPAGIRVSMDGRRETVYSDTVWTDHRRFYAGAPDMVDYPDRIGADHVWLPSRFAMVDELTRHGWTKVLDTGKSVVLSRDARAIALRPLPEGDTVFPWP